MTITTWLYQNKSKHLPGKTKSSKWAVRRKAWEQRKSKGEKEKQHKGTFILLTHGAWLSSRCHWNYFRTGLTSSLSPLLPTISTERGRITAFRDKTLSLPQTCPSRRRLGVKPIPQLLPSRIRAPFRICSVKRTLQLAAFPGICLARLDRSRSVPIEVREILG